MEGGSEEGGGDERSPEGPARLGDSGGEEGAAFRPSRLRLLRCCDDGGMPLPLAGEDIVCLSVDDGGGLKEYAVKV